MVKNGLPSPREELRMQWFSIRDVGLIAKLPVSAAIATIVPPDRWAQLSDFLVRT